VLGLDATHDERAIKRAYAAKLKAIDVDADRQSFLNLRTAFESAREQAKWLKPKEEKVKDEASSLADPSLDFRPENLRAAPVGNLARKKPIEPREKVRVTAASKSEDDAPRKTRLKGKGAKPPILTETTPEKTRVKTRSAAGNAAIDDVEPKVRVTFGKAEEAVENTGFRLEVASPWVETASDGAKLDALLSRLSKLLRRNKGAPVDEGAVEKTFLQLLDAPELDNVGRREQVETQIAEMAIRARDRGHFLLLLAYWHFDWHSRADDFSLHWPLSEVVELAPAAQKLRAMQGIGARKTSDPDQNAYLWLQSTPPSRWNPVFWTRRSKVLGLVNRARSETPRLVDLIGRDKIAAWETVAFSGRRLLILMAALIYGAFQWSITSALHGTATPILPEASALLVAAIIAVAVVFAERAETQRLEADRYRYGHSPPLLPFAALGGMALLVLLFAMLPPHPWLAMASVPITMGLFYLTGISVLHSPARDRSVIVERRFTIGALLLAGGLMGENQPILVQQTAVPWLFFCWAAARLYDPLQTLLDRQRKVRRWQLQAGIWLAAACCFGWWAVAGQEMFRTERILLHIAALLIVVAHDMITPRNAEIPGSNFLILPFLTFFAAIAYPVPVMLTVVMLRCLPVFHHAWQSRQRAVESGRSWHDRGGGYNSGTDFSNITFFGWGGPKEGSTGGMSRWQFFGLLFIGIQVLRLLLSWAAD
jgi:hypothetical protein